MKTILLDRAAWDMVLDASGNIAVASEPYAIAQDVASAIRTFIGECHYDTSLGIPYFAEILGQWPRALSVPGVVAAQCVIMALEGRALSGYVQITDTTGVVSDVTF